MPKQLLALVAFSVKKWLNGEAGPGPIIDKFDGKKAKPISDEAGFRSFKIKFIQKNNWKQVIPIFDGWAVLTLLYRVIESYHTIRFACFSHCLY